MFATMRRKNRSAKMKSELGQSVEAGAVHRVMTHEEFGRYELAEDLTQHHHHLVCRSCGAVEDVTVAPSLERQVQRSLVEVEDRTGFSAVSHRLDLIGTCRNCS